MQKVALVLSFDHELSLGGGELYARDLFDPTVALLDKVNALGVPICLFTDILCHLRFREWDPNGFCRPYARQIQQALLCGHEVQLHLHPHWLDVSLQRGRFQLGRRYSLGDFAMEPAPLDMEGIVKRGLNELTAICSDAVREYKCVAYRAGGYSFSSENGKQIEILRRNGILIDSSVVKGYFLKTVSSLVDFRQTPADANWFVEPGAEVTVAGSHGIFEVPIASSPRTPLNNFPFLIKRVLLRKRRRATAGATFHSHKDRLRDRASRLFPHSAWMLSFDTFTEKAEDLIEILVSHIERHPTQEVIYCAAIGHPKSMGPYQLNLLHRFVGLARDVFGNSLSFTTFQKIAKARLLNEVRVPANRLPAVAGVHAPENRFPNCGIRKDE